MEKLIKLKFLTTSFPTSSWQPFQKSFPRTDNQRWQLPTTELIEFLNRIVDFN